MLQHYNVLCKPPRYIFKCPSSLTHKHYIHDNTFIGFYCLQGFYKHYPTIWKVFCYGSSLGSNPDNSQNLSKIHKRHKQRSGQHTLARQKKYTIWKVLSIHLQELTNI